MGYPLPAYAPPSLYAAYKTLPQGQVPAGQVPAVGTPTTSTPWVLPPGVTGSVPTNYATLGSSNADIFKTAQPLTADQLANWQPQFVTTAATTPPPTDATAPVVDGSATPAPGAAVTPLIDGQPIVTADPNATANTKYLADAGGQVQTLTTGEVVTAGWGVNPDGTMKNTDPNTQLDILANQYNAVNPLVKQMNQEVMDIATEIAATDYGSLDQAKVINVLTGRGPIDLATMIDMQQVEAGAAAEKHGVNTENTSGRPLNGDEYVEGRDYNRDGTVDAKDKEWYEKDQAALQAWDATWDYNGDGTVGDAEDKAEFERRSTAAAKEPETESSSVFTEETATPKE
jgi:hypothetical protein